MLTLTCASTASVGISLLVTNLSDSEDNSIATTIKTILNEALGLEDEEGGRMRREVLCVRPSKGKTGTIETWEPCDEQTTGGWTVNVERGAKTSCAIMEWLQATVDSSIPPTCLILTAQVTVAAAVLVVASTVSLALCCGRKMLPRRSERERTEALERGHPIGRFAYKTPRTPDEEKEAHFWQACCPILSPWIVYTDQERAEPADDTGKDTEVTATEGEGGEIELGPSPTTSSSEGPPRAESAELTVDQVTV